MTEEEAKTKWCPMARHGGDGEPAANRWDMGLKPDPKWGTSLNPVVCRCITSECMWWVQTDNEALPTLPGEEAEYEPAGHCGAVK